MTGLAVATTGLSKRFGHQLAVDSLDLAVPQGSVYGFLGPNGSGKTTTIRMILGLVAPTAGTVELLGRPMPLGAPHVLPRVGALVEGPAFHPYLTGRDNLVRLDAADRTVDPRTASARIDEALDRVGLLAAARKRYRAYSLGMRQRLAIASALLRARDLLVLDEPTNGLDPGEMREVRQLVRRVAEAGSTVLFSSHVLAEVEQICTHAVVMDKGKFVASGSVVDLIGAAGTVYLEVDDVALARGVLEGIPSVRSIEDEAPGLAVMMEGGRRSDLVAALVAAGIAVETVTARRRLEDAFLGLVEGV